MSHEPTSDLGWQAFLYISGEMSASETESFEELLGADQTAREALAQAVEMLATLTAVSPNDIAVPSRHTNRRWRIFAAVAMAAALVLICFSLTRLQPADDDPVRDLVSLWADSSDPANDSMEADPAAVPTNVDDGDLTIPGWMLAAVESASDDLQKEE